MYCQNSDESLCGLFEASLDELDDISHELERLAFIAATTDMVRPAAIRLIKWRIHDAYEAVLEIYKSIPYFPSQDY